LAGITLSLFARPFIARTRAANVVAHHRLTMFCFCTLPLIHARRDLKPAAIFCHTRGVVLFELGGGVAKSSR